MAKKRPDAKLFLVFLVAGSLLSLLVQDAFASQTISNAMCYVIVVMYGAVGRGIAIIGIIILGIGATLGKVTWGLALMVGIGVAVIFGAPTIVANLTGVTILINIVSPACTWA